MTKKTKKRLLTVLAILLLVGGSTALYIWKYVINKPHTGVQNATGIKVTAADLLNQYVQDSAAANKKYTDKVVEVSGEVVESSPNQQNQPVVKLKTTQDGAFINCTFEETAITANPGAKITVKGICSGYSGGDADMGLPGDVVVVRCYLVK